MNEYMLGYVMEYKLGNGRLGVGDGQMKPRKCTQWKVLIESEL